MSSSGLSARRRAHSIAVITDSGTVHGAAPKLTKP